MPEPNLGADERAAAAEAVVERLFYTAAGLPRRTMLAAVALELANAACAAVHWLIARPTF